MRVCFRDGLQVVEKEGAGIGRAGPFLAVLENNFSTLRNESCVPICLSRAETCPKNWSGRCPCRHGGLYWSERDREWQGDECVTSHNPPLLRSTKKESVAPARTPIGEGRVHSLQPQARLNHTTMARTTRSTVTTQPDKDKLSPASDDAQSSSLSKNKKSKKRKRDSVNEHEDQPATKLPRQEEDISHSPKTEDLQSPPPTISETYLDSDLAEQILETLEMYVNSTNHFPLRFQFTTIS